MASTRTLFSFEVRKKKSLILMVRFFSLSPGSCPSVLLFVSLVLFCVVLCFLVLSSAVVWPEWLSEQFRSSSCLWSSRLLVLPLFLHNLSVRFFFLGLRCKALSPSQVLPLKGYAVLRVSLCRNPLSDRQVLKVVTQPNVTILGQRGLIGDDR